MKIKLPDKVALNHIAQTGMQTKLVADNSADLAAIVVDALLQIADKTGMTSTMLILTTLKSRKSPEAQPTILN